MSANAEVLTPDGGDLFEFGQGKLWIGFVLRSLRRHKLAAAFTFLLISVLASFLALSSPKQYLASTQLIARNDSVLNGLLIPGNSAPDRPSPPATLADATIKAQDNLEKIITELNLVGRYQRNEGRVAKLKRRLIEKLTGAPTPAAQHDDVLALLRSGVTVSTADNESVKQTINVGVTWTDPEIAKEIADAVNKHFFEDRRFAEVGPVEDALQIARSTLDEANKKVAQVRFDLNIPEDDERILPDSSPLKPALAIQAGLAQRTQDLELQLKNTEKAFGYRYRVVTPAEAPKAPLSGSLVSLIAGLMAAAIVASFVTTALDIVRGRVVEPWQVTRRLGLPLLAELKG